MYRSRPGMGADAASDGADGRMGGGRAV